MSLPFIRVTHSGFYPDSRPNTSSILIADVSYTGLEGQNRKAPVYVPFGGSIDLPLSTDVVFSYGQGDIAQYIAGGYVTATIFGLLDEAPIDGTPYARQNAMWVPASTSPVQEWRVSGSGSGTLDVFSLPYANNEGPDEIEVRVLLVLVGDLGRSGILECLGKASRGAGNIAVSSTRRRADNLAGNQNIQLVGVGGTNMVVRLTLGGNPVEYRAIIRRRTWSDFA